MYIGSEFTFSIRDVLNCTYQLSRDGGSNWETIASNVVAIITNQGQDNEEIINSFSWTITGLPSNNCKIKYIDLSDNSEIVGDTFTIAFSPNQEFIVFVNSGQSNSVGVDESTYTTRTDDKMYFTEWDPNNTTQVVIKLLADPIGVGTPGMIDANGDVCKTSSAIDAANKIREQNPNSVIVVLNAGRGSTGLCVPYAGQPNLWKSTGAGTLQQNLIDKVNSTLSVLGATNYKIVIYWYQGETDALGNVNEDDYNSEMDKFYANMRTVFGGNLKGIVSTVLGTAENIATEYIFTKIRNAKLKWSNGIDKIHVVATDLARIPADNLHLTATAMKTLGVRVGNACNYLLGKVSTWRGPYIESSSLSVDKKTVTFNINSANAISGSSLTGWTFTDSVTGALTPTSLVLSGKTVTATFTNAVAAGQFVIGYQDKNLSTITNLVKETSGLQLPLEPYQRSLFVDNQIGGTLLANTEIPAGTYSLSASITLGIYNLIINCASGNVQLQGTGAKSILLNSSGMISVENGDYNRRFIWTSSSGTPVKGDLSASFLQVTGSGKINLVNTSVNYLQSAYPVIWYNATRANGLITILNDLRFRNLGLTGVPSLSMLIGVYGTYYTMGDVIITGLDIDSTCTLDNTNKSHVTSLYASKIRMENCRIAPTNNCLDGIYNVVTNGSKIVYKNCEFKIGTVDNIGAVVRNDAALCPQIEISNCLVENPGAGNGVSFRNNNAITAELNDNIIQNCDAVGAYGVVKIATVPLTLIDRNNNFYNNTGHSNMALHASNFLNQNPLFGSIVAAKLRNTNIIPNGSVVTNSSLIGAGSRSYQLAEIDVSRYSPDGKQKRLTENVTPGIYYDVFFDSPNRKANTGIGVTI